jgi:hypothetical protein
MSYLWRWCSGLRWDIFEISMTLKYVEKLDYKNPLGDS